MSTPVAALQPERLRCRIGQVMGVDELEIWIFRRVADALFRSTRA
jgi:hypothetical protein